MKEFLKRWIINTLAVLVAAHIVPGISYDQGDWVSLLLATLLLGILNAVVRPILILLALPLLLVTLGLFMVFINATLLYLVAALFTSIHVASFGSALLGALVISFISLFLNSLTGSGSTRMEVRRSGRVHRRPDGRSGSDHHGGGPTIDV